MKNKKLTAFLILAVITVFLLAFCLFYSKKVYGNAYARGVEVSQSATSFPMAEEAPSDGEESSGDNAISDSVKDYLISVYGEDYEKYYNDIVEKWGSIENYLLNASENLPAEYKYKATELLTTINAYIGVAADGILFIFAFVYILLHRKKDKQVNTDLTKLKALDNQIEEAQLAIMNSQKAQSAALQELLPAHKFEVAVNTLKASDEQLTAAEAEVKRLV